MRPMLAWGLLSLSACALLGLASCGSTAAAPSRSPSTRAAAAATIPAPDRAPAPAGQPVTKTEASTATPGGAPAAAEAKPAAMAAEPLPAPSPPAAGVTGAAAMPTAQPAAPAAQAVAPAPPPQPVRLDALGDPLPPGAIARLGSNRWHHPSAVVGLAFGADGRTLVSAGSDGELREWEVPSGKLLRIVTPAQEPIGALSASRDGTILGLSRLEGDAEFVDGATGRSIPPGPDLGLGNHAAVSPDGHWLALWGRPWSKVTIMSKGGGAPHDLNESVEEFQNVVFDEDGSRVALLARRRDDPTQRQLQPLLSLRDPASDDVAWRVEIHGEPLVSAVFSPDGQRIYAGDAGCGVHVFDAGSGESIAYWDLCAGGQERFPVESVAITTDGERLVAVHYKTAMLLDARSGAVLALLAGHGGPISAVACSPDGQLVATACNDHVVRLFDARSGQRVGAPAGHDGSITHVLCAPDGRSICTIGTDGQCLLWPGDASGSPRELMRVPIGQVVAAFSPDGSTLAVCASEPELSLYDVPSASLREHWSTGAAGPALLLAFSPDGSALATLHHDERLRIWPVAGGQPGAEQPSLTSAPLTGVGSALDWLPDGRIAVGTSVVQLMDAKTGDKLGTLMGSSPIAEIACRRDGRELATANADRTATIYRLDPAPGSGAKLLTLGGHAGRVNTADFSPDGSLLATGGANEGVVHVWEVEGGSEIARLAGHEGDIRSLAFTSDGRALVSASDDAAALVWAMPPERAAPQGH